MLLIAMPAAANIVPAVQTGFPPTPGNGIDPAVVSAALNDLALTIDADLVADALDSVLPADVDHAQFQEAISHAAASLDPVAVAAALDQIAGDTAPADIEAALAKASELDAQQFELALGQLASDMQAAAPGLATDDPRETQALLELGVQPYAACEDGERRAEQDTNGTLWFLGGCLFTGLAVIGAFVLQPSPPASVLVGQDATYVAQYTDCYEDRAKSIQTKNALFGALTTIGVYVVLYAVLVAASVSTL